MVAPLALAFVGCLEAWRARESRSRSLGYVVSRSSGCSTACFEAVDSRLPILGLFTYLYINRLVCT